MKKLICFHCGEEWDKDFVYDDEPDSFTRTHGLIMRCPACDTHITPIKDEKLMEEAERLAIVVGPDIEVLMQHLEEVGLVNV